jgi:hypothetical protein
MKTTYLKFIKSLIDPVVGGQLYNPLIDLKQIEQIFARNYFVAFDNVSEVRLALSNFICAAVSGTSVDFRKLFTSQGIVRLVIKCCVELHININKYILHINRWLEAEIFEGIEVEHNKHTQRNPKVLGDGKNNKLDRYTIMEDEKK